MRSDFGFSGVVRTNEGHTEAERMWLKGGFPGQVDGGGEEAWRGSTMATNNNNNKLDSLTCGQTN